MIRHPKYLTLSIQRNKNKDYSVVVDKKVNVGKDHIYNLIAIELLSSTTYREGVITHATS